MSDRSVSYPQVIPFRIDKGQTRAFSLVAGRRARLDVTTVLVDKVGVEPTFHDIVECVPESLLTHMYQADWLSLPTYKTGLELRASYFRELTNKTTGCCIVCTHKHNATLSPPSKAWDFPFGYSVATR